MSVQLFIYLFVYKAVVAHGLTSNPGQKKFSKINGSRETRKMEMEMKKMKLECE